MAAVDEPQFRKLVIDRLDGLQKVDPDSYLDELKEVQELSHNYIEYKKSLCKGEFTAMTLGQLEDGKAPTKKLSREEKEFCLRGLKTFQRRYIEGLYLARKKQLEWLQEGRLEELKNSRDEALKDLEKSFERQKRRRKRRKRRS